MRPAKAKPAPPAMQMQFEGDQEYQLKAIAAVTDLFQGQPKNEHVLQFLGQGGFQIVANQLVLAEEELLANTQAVQGGNGLVPSPTLSHLAATIDGPNGPTEVRFPNFSIEMETGTGKTYVYIRTALELARRFGLLKFIIVVPSVAIREGVLKTFQMTARHFRSLFSNMPYRWSVYDSGNLSRLRQFADVDHVDFMIMTIASFDRDVNVIRQKGRDQMGGIPALHVVQAARPILILDEPQNFSSQGREGALASLNPLFALRYSATHAKDKLFNLVYRLTPFDAYRLRLVKRIEVAGVEQVGSGAPAFMRLDAVGTAKRTLTARFTLHILAANGTLREKAFTLKPDGKPLDAVTNLPDYAGYVISEISIIEQAVYFTNGRMVTVGETTGADRAAFFDAQIRTTIEEHFKKQRRLRQYGIKVLSLFFIDRVASYAEDDGLIRRLFTAAFNDLKMNYEEWAGSEAEAVQGAYFAQRRIRSGDVLLEESKTGESERDREAYDLIMRDKEALLTFASESDSPEVQRRRQVCFLFSHSALREGWDNPNVFQICTLNQTTSQTRKRQEIGRGVRLCVNQAGQRVRDERLNVLTVVANQSYEAYVRALQDEVAADYGLVAPPQPENARERGVARLNPSIFTLSDDFQKLWEQIKTKTRYAVQVDSAALVADVVVQLNLTPIAPPRVQVSKSLVDVGDEDTFTALAVGLPRFMAASGLVQQANLVDIVGHMLRAVNPPVRITRATLIRLLRGLSLTRQREAAANPAEFSALAGRLIRAALNRQLVEGIRYHRIDAWYEMSQFAETIESWREHLVPAHLSVYDHVVIDSEVERRFVNGLEGPYRALVRAYVKLPPWFTVPTPIGHYRPDWAIVVSRSVGEAERLYFVAETKGTAMLEALRADEAAKIACGKAHFSELGVPFYADITVEGVLRQISQEGL